MSESYKDKFWVIEQIRKALAHNNELSDYFDWLLQVWNTNRDFEYPSLEECDPNRDAEHQCGNCSGVFLEEELSPIKDYFSRVEPGDVVPSGECPRCGALCYPS